MQKNNKIIIFLPAKNEAKTIASVINDSKKQLLELAIAADFLVIDDGSTDNTQQEAERSGAKVIRHEKSRGLGYIFRQASGYARENNYDILITIDADKQFSESEINKLLLAIKNNEADFVTGSRFIERYQIPNMPKAKMIGNYLVSKIISSILKKKYYDVSCGFRAYNRTALNCLYTTADFTYTQEVFLNLGVKDIRIKEIPIQVTYFPERSSRIASNLWHYGRQMLTIILKCVVIYRPMKFFGGIASICFIIGVPILIFVGIHYILTSFVAPYRSIGLASLILVVIGTILFTTGLLLKIISRIQLTIEEVLRQARK